MVQAPGNLTCKPLLCWAQVSDLKPSQWWGRLPEVSREAEEPDKRHTPLGLLLELNTRRAP